jgi:hypothetical protein
MLLQIPGMGTLMVVPIEVTGLMMVILSASIPVWLVDSMLRQVIVAHHSSPLCCPSHFGSLQISLLFLNSLPIYPWLVCSLVSEPIDAFSYSSLAAHNYYNY